MLTRQLFRLIINYKLILANGTDNNRIDFEECSCDLNRRDGFNGRFRCRGVVSRGGSSGGRRGIFRVKEVMNDTVKVRAVKEEVVIGRGNRRELESGGIVRRR